MRALVYGLSDIENFVITWTDQIDKLSSIRGKEEINTERRYKPFQCVVSPNWLDPKIIEILSMLSFSSAYYTTWRLNFALVTFLDTTINMYYFQASNLSSGHYCFVHAISNSQKVEKIIHAYHNITAISIKEQKYPNKLTIQKSSIIFCIYVRNLKFSAHTHDRNNKLFLWMQLSIITIIDG